MPCDTRKLPNQTLAERKEEVRSAIQALARKLASGQAKVIVGPGGAVSFAGWEEGQRSRVTDSCAFRAILVSGSALAKMKIAQAQQLAGVAVNTHSGIHSHDGGQTWHGSHK